MQLRSQGLLTMTARLIAEKSGKTYRAAIVNAPGSYRCPSLASSFACLVWDHVGGITEFTRANIARALLGSGCRYVVCGGQDSEAWHDTVDIECRRRQPQQPKDEDFVMTSWHDGASPEDVAFFFVFCTFPYESASEDTSFDEHLVLHIGDGHAIEELNAAVRKQALKDVS